jgi:hypothetical protein
LNLEYLLQIQWFSSVITCKLDGCLVVCRTEGWRAGFFKGLSMNWVKGPVAVGISFATYETVREYLRHELAHRR